MVGTWARNPAPTISPIGRVLFDLVRLQVAVEVQGVVATLSTDATDARAAEGRREVADQEAVDPYRAGAHGQSESVGLTLVGGKDHGREAVSRGVRQRDRFVFSFKGLNGEDGTEDFILNYLGVIGPRLDQR